MNSGNTQQSFSSQKQVSVSSLDGMLLDYYAAAARGASFERWDMVVNITFPDGAQKMLHEPGSDGDAYYSPSTLDAQAENLAFEAHIRVRALNDGRYAAQVVDAGREDEWRDEIVGDTRNIAITRCFVASKFGLEFPELAGYNWTELEDASPKAVCTT